MLGLDATTWRRLQPLLDQALDLPPAARVGWLDRLQEDERALRPVIERLLAESASELPPLPDIDRHAGECIGPYRLLAPLGSGGMGEVWRASRADGLLQREVALKLPRADLATPALARRMARERNILGALVHPHIARLYDAGVGSDGQPYLALELVEGERIDLWADRHALDVPARVRLALQAVRAVAHAHAQLVVHRDLKPSNLLVDAQGQVKLLDFGIAKLLDRDDGAPGLTEVGMATPMTPRYASPEQLAGAPVGTRSDLYSLAVVLFELLAGDGPFVPADDTRAAWEDAVLRGDPRRASGVAREPARARALRGDLDTVLACALARRPEDRYPSADALAADLERCLDGRPLLVRAQPRRVLLAKFVRRNRLAVGAAALALGAVLAGAGVALWQARIAELERLHAQQVKEFVVGVLSETSPYRGRAPQQLNAVDLVHRAFDRFKASDIQSPQVRLELLAIMGETLTTMGDLDLSEEVSRLAFAEASRLDGQPEAEVTAGLSLTQLLRLRGRPQEAFDLAGRLLVPARRAAARQPQLEVLLQQQRSVSALDLGRHDDQVQAAAEAVRLARQRFGERDDETLSSLVNLAMALYYARRFDEALPAAEDAHRTALATLGAAHVRTVEAQTVLGRVLGERGDLARAGALLQASVGSLRQLMGPDAMLVAMTQSNLAQVLTAHGRLAAAAEAARDARRIVLQQSDAESFNHAAVAATLGDALAAAHDDAAALALLQPAAATLLRLLGPEHPRTVATQATLALVLARLHDDGQAQALLDALAPAAARLAGPERLRLARAGALLASRAGRADEAGALLRPLLAATADSPRLRREQALARVEAAQHALAAGRMDEAAAGFTEALAALQALEAEPTPARRMAAAGLASLRQARRAAPAAEVRGDGAPPPRAVQIRG